MIFFLLLVLVVIPVLAAVVVVGCFAFYRVVHSEKPVPHGAKVFLISIASIILLLVLVGGYASWRGQRAEGQAEADVRAAAAALDGEIVGQVRIFRQTLERCAMAKADVTLPDMASMNESSFIDEAAARLRDAGWTAEYIGLISADTPRVSVSNADHDAYVDFSPGLPFGTVRVRSWSSNDCEPSR